MVNYSFLQIYTFQQKVNYEVYDLFLITCKMICGIIKKIRYTKPNFEYCVDSLCNVLNTLFKEVVI